MTCAEALGYEAKKDGLNLTQNPYTDFYHSFQWFMGWCKRFKEEFSGR